MGPSTGQFITALTAEHEVIRFVDWRTCRANPNPEVREMALKHLHEFAVDGDPFSQALLEEREIP